SAGSSGLANGEIVPAPPLIKPKSWRWAATLNLFLPGAGLFYLGRRKMGMTLAVVFLISLVAALGIFLTDYFRYLNIVLGGDLLQEGKLEQIDHLFHKRWLVALLFCGVALHLVSLVAF